MRMKEKVNRMRKNVVKTKHKINLLPTRYTQEDETARDYLYIKTNE